MKTKTCAGLDQLCRVDPRFQAYRKSLFSQSTKTFDRDQQTAEANARVDASILSFCALLAPYFLLPPAFKALEYLIRRYNAHERNVTALMHAALPYHGSNEFVRLVQTLRLEGSEFAFLAPMQKSRVSLPRALLVQRCLTDRSLLRFVCELGKELGSAQVGARAVAPFYAALLCEIVAAAPVIDEDFVAVLLPYLLKGLSADVIPDFRAATYMILVQLATRVTFSIKLVQCKLPLYFVLNQQKDFIGVRGILDNRPAKLNVSRIDRFCSVPGRLMDTSYSMHFAFEITVLFYTLIGL